MKDIVIFGSGGFAREVHQIIEDINQEAPTYRFLGFLDSNASKHGEHVHECPIVGDESWLQHPDNAHVQVVLALGSPAVKRKIVQRLGVQMESRYPSLVHPRAWVGNRVEIGPGSIICAGNLITTDIVIGAHVVLNIGTTVGHDTRIGDYANVSPNVSISGAVILGEGADLGTSSCVIQGVSIGSWSTVGAGAAVVGEVPPNVTAVGIPAKAIKTRAENWHLS